MKKLFLLSLLSVFAFNLKAQTINGVPLKDIDVDYLQIVGTPKLLSTKQTVELDFGQRTKLFSFGTEKEIKDADGKTVVFNSMIDALNFLSKNGFEFMSSYTVTPVNSSTTVYYILRNKKNKL